MVDWAFWPALVILALNVEELATEYGWNKLLVRNWSPAADSVLDLLQTRSLRYSATLVVGIAVGVWLDLLARKLDLQRSQQSS